VDQFTATPLAVPPLRLTVTVTSRGTAPGGSLTETLAAPNSIAPPASLSVMVTVVVGMAPSSPPSGTPRVTVKFWGPSIRVSTRSGIVRLLLVTPAGRVRGPEVAV
jgi:hypothetical protein